MFSKLRRRMTWANVAMTLALVFAMTGGAYAAKKYLITSTKQISPKVLGQLKGKAGPAGPAGSAGPAGPAGVSGKDGANGANGKDGANGTSATTSPISTGSATCNHNGGVEVKSASPAQNVCNGTTGFTETLPSKKTETGAWAATAPGGHYEVEEGGTPTTKSVAVYGFVKASISFTIPLAAELDEHHVHYAPVNVQEGKIGSGAGEACEGKSGSNPGEPLKECEEEQEVIRAACPGSVAAPSAESGNLCIYEQVALNVLPFVLILGPHGSTGAGTYGAVMQLTVPGKKEAVNGAWGSWAVTAP